MTKQEVDSCIVFMLRLEADAQLNFILSDSQFLQEMWAFQKSGAKLKEDTLLRDAITYMRRKYIIYN